MDLRLSLAIIMGKIISFLNKLTGSGATAAPGLYALKIDPHLVKKLTKKLRYGNIIISGTNGKTTTARLTSDIVSTKFRVVHNRQGSNLLRGIASTLISSSSLTGQNPANLGIWEVDEATLPQALENIEPQIIALLNLFRDQLDRYGEVDSIRKKWQTGLLSHGRGTTLILNADDPGISYLGKFFKGKIIYFGIGEKKLNLPEISQVADVKHCLNCGQKLNYSTTLSSHLGHYTCPKCRFKRPKPDISASNLKFNSNFSTSIKLTVNGQLLFERYRDLTVNYSLPGLYNVYNVLAAVAIADQLKIDHTKIRQNLESFSAAFGRFQKVTIQGKSAAIFLIKNPTGANEVLRILSQKQNMSILAILNDKIADGRDVSWIWDTNWEILTTKIKRISVSGTRAWDLATRIKYAGMKMSKNNVYENIDYSITKSIGNLSTIDTLIILPTYTAMLEVQKSLARLGGQKWHKD
ncbi:MAG: MurT ligase domain-containing protein [Patescibacteria group bacterium]